MKKAPPLPTPPLPAELLRRTRELRTATLVYAAGLDLDRWQQLAKESFGSDLAVLDNVLNVSSTASAYFVRVRGEPQRGLRELLQNNERRAQPSPIIVAADIPGIGTLPRALVDLFALVFEVSQ